jgi:alkyl sulfatase BDS1-like metallo-beta-lactamase superfamily hydrolase
MEYLSSKADHIDWCREMVLELSSQGHSQREIANMLQLVLVLLTRMYHFLDNSLGTILGNTLRTIT